MEGPRTTKKKWARKCRVCSVDFIVKDAYVLHLLSKRHRKNIKKRNKYQTISARKRTVCISGERDKLSLQNIARYFLEYGVNRVAEYPNYVLIEFDTGEICQRILQKKYFKIHATCFTVAPMKRSHHEDSQLILSPYLENCLSQAATGHQLDRHIGLLINEIQLLPREADDRESLRRGIVNYLSPYFPKVIGYIFGSSANNLGFSGCDVDIYIDIGVYPWSDCETKALAQAQARDITWFLADRIRRSGKAVKVTAIPRARVPIVKFQDRASGIMVDLSFRHGMPVYNTQLIKQYTHSHPLVRPYLMLIRYWAKVQDVAGGGRPTNLITNYALTMMMLFYLMYRNDPIVPSVSSLRNEGAYTPVFIDIWDVGFCCDISEWCHKIHRVHVMDLVSEFFSFFGELKASEWVISPLTGTLLAREEVQNKSSNLPDCLEMYLHQDEAIQLGKLCVQDPFEHSNNCTRGLSKRSCLEFQYKCRTAASICKNILTGVQTLNELLQPIELTPDMSEIYQEPSQVKEVITLEDSDISQDIEVVVTLDRKSQDDRLLSISEESVDVEMLPSPEETSEVEILDDPHETSQDCEILAIHQEAAEPVESIRKINDQNDTLSESSAKVLKGCSKTGEDVTVETPSSKSPGSSAACTVMMENNTTLNPLVLSHFPKDKYSIFSLDYSQAPDFTITLDGNVHGERSKLGKNYDTGQAACLLIQFVLQQCLKIEITTVENSGIDGKRKALLQHKETTAESHKRGCDGDSVLKPVKYFRLTKFICLAPLQLWNNRKKISKTVARKIDETPLQFELAVTEAQIGKKYMASDNPLRFVIEVWQELDNPKIMHVTGRSLSDTKITQGHMITMFIYFTSLSQNLLRKLTHYVRNCPVTVTK